MVGLNIEGDLSSVSEQQLGFIKEVIENQGFGDANVVFESVGKAGDNYVANVKRIIIQGADGSTLKMIAKVAPNIEQLRAMANTQLLFKNECIMYSKVLPKFEQIQASADVPSEDRLKFAACYGSYEVAPNEVILLEDLKESGFEMLDRFKSLSDDCIKSVLKNFAILHSLSYVVKHKEPEVFEQYKSDLRDLWSEMADQEEMKMFLAQLDSSVMMVLQKDIHKDVMTGFMEIAMEEIAELSKYNKDSKYSVVQQGDSWINNIMFKFCEENITNSIMIDYQLAKVTSPVSDLMYMIFNCTDYKTRKEYFHNWIDFYHNQLDQQLSSYGLEVCNIYPRDKLELDLKKHGKMSLSWGVILSTMLIKKSEDAEKIKEAIASADMNEVIKQQDAATFDPETLLLYKTKLEGLIDSHIELGYI